VNIVELFQTPDAHVAMLLADVQFFFLLQLACMQLNVECSIRVGADFTL